MRQRYYDIGKVLFILLGITSVNYYIDERLTYMLIVSYILNYVNQNKTVVIWNLMKGVTIVRQLTGPKVRYFKNMISFIWTKENKCIELINEKGDIECALSYPFSTIPWGENTTPKYNFVIYKWKSPTDINYEHYILRYNRLREVTDNFAFSEIKFLAPRIILNDSNIFDLSNYFMKDNYYMCNNCLFDKDFVIWQLKTNFNYVLDLINNNYKVEFVDHNMIPQTVNQDKAVIINKTSYDIIHV